MPTANRRVATYLPKYIDDRLESFKVERGLKGDSPALIAILEEFFGVSQEVARLSDSGITTLTQRIDSIEQKIAQIKGETLSELPSELSSLLFFWKAETKKELLEELRRELKSKLLSESKSDTPDKPLEQVEQLKFVHEEGITLFATKELAHRLKIDPTTPSRWKPGKAREKTPEQLLEATRKQDPDGIGWIYVPELDRFKPERSLPSESLSVQESELPVKAASNESDVEEF